MNFLFPFFLAALPAAASDFRLPAGAGEIPQAAAPLPPAPAPVPEGVSGSIIIYAYPPRRVIDWSSPRAALAGFSLTALGQALSSGDQVEFVSDFGEQGSIPATYKSTMGHTIAHIDCVLPDGARYDSWTSFSGQDFQEVDKELVMKKKAGLAMLYEDYIDGHIISGVENKMRLIYYSGKSGVSPRYLSQKVDAQACGRARDMAEFFKSFHFPKGSTLQDLQRRDPESLLYFTTNLDPYLSYTARRETGRGKVGGGCAPYGVGLLKAAGKYDNSLDEVFKLRLSVSERLIGGLPEADGRLREVSLDELLGDLGSSWRHPGYADRPFENYDPYLIWKFIGEARSCLTGGECSGPAAAWAARSAGRAAAGETQRLSDTRTVETDRGGDSGPSYERLTRKVAMDGIVLE